MHAKYLAYMAYNAESWGIFVSGTYSIMLEILISRKFRYVRTLVHNNSNVGNSNMSEILMPENSDIGNSHMSEIPVHWNSNTIMICLLCVYINSQLIINSTPSTVTY